MPDPDPTQYDSFAAEYDLHAASAPYNALYDRPAMLDLIGDVSGRAVLDAACGPGHYLTELVARGASSVVGCDASPAMISVARTRVPEDVDLHVHSLERPMSWLSDESIDIAICALAYHYITDRVGFLREVYRVLRPDGALVISTHHPTGDWHRLGGSYFAIEAVTETWSAGWEITAWRMPLGQITDEMHQAGFVIERLVEPLPADAMRETHPRSYARLSQEPGFIMFRVVRH